MIRIRTLLVPAFFILAGLILADACTTYVRVPSICPHDPYCLKGDGSADAATREREFVGRAAAAIVEVHASRYVPNNGRITAGGAGVIIGAKGYVMTAYHIVEGADTVTVTYRRNGDAGSAGRDVPMTPLVLSREKDLALLVPPDDERLPAAMPVRYDHAVPHDAVCILGTGDRLRCGTVTDVDVAMGITHGFAMIDIRLSTGDAGGPVMNVCGELVGISIYADRGNRRSIYVPLDEAMRTLGLTPSDLR